MDDRDEEPVIIYHSHTATEAYPSRTDITYANEPGAHYVLVSTADTDDAGPFQFRSYRIVDGEITEEEVEIVEAYPARRRVRARGQHRDRPDVSTWRTLNIHHVGSHSGSRVGNRYDEPHGSP